MNALEHACPKCGARMEAGFVVDLTQHHSYAQSGWVEGEPEPSFWTGLKIDERAKHAITTYRCVDCGYLESYCPAGADRLLRPAAATDAEPENLLRASSAEEPGSNGP